MGGPGLRRTAYYIHASGNFRDLFQPSGSGSLSGFVGKMVFSIAKQFRILLPAAGPAAVLITIVCWTVMVAVGFAMIYWPNVPDGFNVPRSEHRDVISTCGLALYFSFEALATLGQGDVKPKLGWIRLLSITEALLGFSLLTASISWIVLIYPALGRMKTLARFATDLLRAEEKSGVSIISGNAEQLIGSMAQDVIRTRVDFIHFPLIYYFFSATRSASLPEALSHLLRMANDGCRKDKPDRVRLASATLQVALEDFARLLASRFSHADPMTPEAVFVAFKEDHRTRLLKAD